MHLYSNVCYNFNRYKMKSILMTFMGVGTIMNLTAGNLSEDRTDQPQTGGGKEEFVYSMAGRPERTDLSGRDEPDG